MNISMSVLRTKFKATLDGVCDNHEPCIVRRRNDKDVVIMSLADYNSAMETLHLHSTANNTARLLASINQLRANDIVQHALSQTKNEEN